MRKLMLLIVVLIAAGCGQKGPLVLPPDEVPPQPPGTNPVQPPDTPSPGSTP